MATDWINNAPELLRLENKTRANHFVFLEQVKALFLTEEATPHLEVAMKSAIMAQVRFAFRAAFENPFFDQKILISKALKTTDIELRRLVLKKASTFSDTFYLSIEKDGIQDLFARTRIAFLMESDRRQTPNATQHIKNALLDRSIGVRLYALFLAPKNDIQPLLIYLNAFDAKRCYRQTCIAIWGLSHLGHRESIGAIEQLTKTNIRCIYYSSVSALCNLNTADIVNTLKSNLRNSDLGFSRFSARMLIKMRHSSSIKELQDLAQFNPQPEYIHSVVFPLSDRLQKWDRLELILSLMVEHYREDLTECFSFRINKWQLFYNRSQQSLSSNQRRRLIKTLEQLNVTSHHFENLRFTINSA